MSGKRSWQRFKTRSKKNPPKKTVHSNLWAFGRFSFHATVINESAAGRKTQKQPQRIGRKTSEKSRSTFDRRLDGVTQKEMQSWLIVCLFGPEMWKREEMCFFFCRIEPKKTTSHFETDLFPLEVEFFILLFQFGKVSGNATNGFLHCVSVDSEPD